MTRNSTIRSAIGLCLWCLGASFSAAQSGTWVLDGWPHEKHGYFAGRTEIIADGARLKITEWPGHEAKNEEALVTYYLGQTVVKVFPWNGERVGLVFEAETPLPRANLDDDGKLLLPAPYPARVTEESEVPCGDGCTYHIRNVSFQPLEASEFAPGGLLNGCFQPPAEVTLLNKHTFLDRYRIEAPDWTLIDFGEQP